MDERWSKDDPRYIFVLGAAWWEFEKTGGTIWPYDRHKAEKEAERRFPGGRIRDEGEMG